jgi:peptidoglycan-N-acetylglucosamine deacetylase
VPAVKSCTPSYGSRGQGRRERAGRTRASRLSDASAAGHSLGNHSFNHHNLVKLPKELVEEELRTTQCLIDRCSDGPRLFRPPYGATNSTVREVAWRGRYKLVLWNVDALDWRFQDSRWVDRTVAEISPTGHSVVLLHDIFETTVAHMDEFITAICDRHPRVRFSTLA